MNVPTDTAADTARPTNRTLLAVGLVLFLAAIPLAIFVHPILLVAGIAGIAVVNLASKTKPGPVSRTDPRRNDELTRAMLDPNHLRNYSLHRQD